MTKPQSIIQQVLLAFVVAVGLVMAWTVVVFWTEGMIEQTSQSQPVETLNVRYDGEPVIVRYESGVNPAVRQLLTLDRQATAGNAQQVLHPQYLQAPPHTAPSDAYPSRLAGASEGGTPATYWYLFHDGRVNGRARGIGYDAASKRVVGYFGRNGFTSDEPPRDDWFQIAGRSGLSLATPSITQSEPAYLEPHLYLLADGQLWFIDVRRKQVKPLLASPTAFTTGWIWQTLEELPPEEQEDPGSVRTFVPFPRRKLALRSLESLTIVEPRTGEYTSLALPASMQDNSCACIQQADGSYMLLAMPQITQNLRQEIDIAWLDESGEVKREQHVQLASYHSMLNTPAVTAWVLALSAPATLGSALGTFGLSMINLESRQSDTFAAALSSAIAQTWPTIVVVVALSLALAVAAYRRQRRYALPYAALWAVFVFLMGVPGYLAYRLHRAWPVLEDCPRCGELAPRDRDRCSDCGATFPPPPLKGLEVFA